MLKQARKKTFATDTIILLQKAIGSSRIQVEKYGQKPIIVTAPHSILLHRDGNRLHLPEDHTLLYFHNPAGPAYVIFQFILVSIGVIQC